MIYVTGFQSSGTTLYSQHLKASGVDLYPDWYPKFESPYFLHWCNQILRVRDGNSWRFLTLHNINKDTYLVPEVLAHDLHLMIQRRVEPWGFKQPSSIVMIWALYELISPFFEFNVHFVFREPLENIESFLRRRTEHSEEIEKNRGEKSAAELVEQFWLSRNKIALDFYEEFKDEVNITFINSNTLKSSASFDNTKYLPATLEHDLLPETQKVYEELCQLQS